MSQHTSRQPSLTALPLEVLQYILDCCPSASLKQLRLTSKLCKEVAEPILFHTVQLFPHMQCFRQMLDLSVHSILRNHVRDFIYDWRFAIAAINIIQYARKASCQDQEERDRALRQASEFERQTIQVGRDDDIELLFLQDILRSLPKLESITVKEADLDGGPFGPLPLFYEELRLVCGSPSMRGRRISSLQSRSAKRVLVASHSLKSPVRRLTIENACWEYLMAFESDGKHVDLLTPLISRLHSLRLDARVYVFPAPAYLMSNLGIVLNLATTLKHLVLRFGGMNVTRPFTDDVQHNAPMYESILELVDSPHLQSLGTPRSQLRRFHWGTNLESLHLDCLRCRTSELVRLLRRCSFTLKRFDLWSCTLVKDIDSGAKPCLVSFLHEVREHCDQIDVSLMGKFSNMGAQEWLLSYWPKTREEHHSMPAGFSGLRAQVVDWICHRRTDCPIEFLSVAKGASDFTREQFDAGRGKWDPSFIVMNDYLSADRHPESSSAASEYESDGSIDG